MNVIRDINIICEDDCGNAPKKALIRDHEIAMAMKDVNFLESNITEDCLWNIIGANTIHGKGKILSLVNEHTYGTLVELRIDNIITHGNTGATNGTVKFERKKFAFSNIYKFSSFKNAKIKEIISYWIDVN